MKSHYKRLLDLAKSKGHYKGYTPVVRIPEPTQLKFYQKKLCNIQKKLNYYRSMKINYKQHYKVGTLRMFEDELKRKIEEWKTTKQ